MKLRNLLLVATLLILAACVREKKTQYNPGINIYGACTAETVSKFKEIADGYRTLDLDPTEENAKMLIQSCEDLKNLVGDSTCTGTHRYTKKTMTVSYETTKSICDHANGVMKGFRKQL